MNPGPTETSLLDEMRRGDPGALGRLFAVVHDKLRDIARTQRPHRPGSETLTTTALVHEAFIKLFGSESRDFNDRAHFMAVAATAMRQILIGHARRNAATKRGDHQAPASFEAVERALANETGFVTPKADALLALDRALERLHQHSERQTRIVECRFFGGMSIDETATSLGISPATVKRDWSMAQAWLHRELQNDLGMTGEHRPAAIEWSELEALWEMVHELPADQRATVLASRRVEGALRQELDALLDRASAAEAFFDRFLSVVPEAGHAAAIDGLDAGAPVDTLPPPDHDPLLGSTLGHYHIVERLGQGGMGVVYRALDLRLHRTVALKLLRAHTPHDPRAKERLLVEARAAAALDHPNICTIYEVGDTPEMSAFIAMAFYPGRTLEQALEPGPLPVATALDYATQIARGLGAAHERGIIHRDVKPANIIVTADGMAKLLDFGIARLPDVDVSREGVTPGTIAYMSPEQVTSRALDRRTDLWSLGVLLHEMVSGERPFRGDSAGAVLYAILQESPPPVSTVRRELAGHVDSVIARLLEKDPDLRYANAEELIADLTGITEGRAPAKGITPGSRASEATPRAAERDDDDSIVPQAPAPAKRRRRWGRRAWYGAAAFALGAGIVSWSLVQELARSGGQRPARPQGGAFSPQRMAAMDLVAQAKRDVLFRTDSGRRLALDLFKAAIAADSTYAPAHAGLALMGITPGNHDQQTLASAEESARTAARLDNLDPLAHAALGRVLVYNFRFAEAEAHFIRAIELDGPQSQLREFLIWLYVFMGRPRDVLEQAEQFERNNPGGANAIAELARGLLVNGRCDEALAQLDRLAHLRPPPARAGNLAAQCHALRKEWPQAIDAMRRVAATNDQAISYLGYMLARGGQSDSARTIRDTLLARRQRGQGTAYGIAVVYAGLGDFDNAFQWLEKAYDDRSLRPDIMEPVFEDLHRDPRFDKLREKLGTRKR